MQKQQHRSKTLVLAQSDRPYQRASELQLSSPLALLAIEDPSYLLLSSLEDGLNTSNFGSEQ